MIVNEMKLRSILHLKDPIFCLKLTHHPLWTNIEQKCTNTLAELDNISFKVVVYSSLVQTAIVIYITEQLWERYDML